MTQPSSGLPAFDAPGRPFSVFLSHSMKDVEHVDQVRRQLEALGILAWLAELDPRPGTSVLEKIEAVLPTCDAVVFLITTNSIDSAYVQQEVGLARAHRMPMVPLVDHRVDRSKLGLIVELEWIGIDLDNPSEALERVTQSLQPMLLRQASELRLAAAAPGTPQPTGPVQFDPALALLVFGLGIAIGLLLSSYTIKIELGPGVL
jgi:hypothetical protein